MLEPIYGICIFTYMLVSAVYIKSVNSGHMICATANVTNVGNNICA